MWRRREGKEEEEGAAAAAAWLAGVSLGSAPAGALARSGTIGLNLNRVKLHKGAERSRDPAESPKLPEPRADPSSLPPLSLPPRSRSPLLPS